MHCSPVPRLAFLIAAFTGPISAQCQVQWQGGGAVAGTGGPAYASVLWDPDGAGPALPLRVVGGSFFVAGDQLAGNIAAFDESTGAWTSFGIGLNNLVRALAVLPTGELVAAGDFTYAGSVVANRIARWNGTAWSAIGSGLDGVARSLQVLANGDLVVGGDFTTAGGVPASRIARWDGAAWNALGAGVGGGTVSVNTLATLANGDLVAAGNFTTAGGAPASRIARWDGTTWSTFGTGMDSTVLASCRAANGDLLVSGSFSFANGVVANRVARLSATTGTWSGFGAGATSGSANAVVELPNGNIVVGGSMTSIGGVPLASPFAIWNGATWTSIPGNPMGPTMFAVLSNGDLLAGGNVGTGVTADFVSRWNGSQWSPLNSGISGAGYVLAAVALPNGDYVVGGQFQGLGGSSGSNVARWDGSAWQPMGAGLDGSVNALVCMPNGDVVAGGSFTNSGGAPVRRLARWDGVSWTEVGGGVVGSLDVVRALKVLSDGSLAVGGVISFVGNSISVQKVAQWTGSTWSSLGGGVTGLGANVWVNSLAEMPNGDLVVGGIFNNAGGVPANCIARWNGTTWSALGSGLNHEARALAVLPNGALVAAGNFTAAGGGSAQRIARWDGSSWSAFGSGLANPVNALLSLPDGSLLATGSFVTAGGATASRIARWNGTAWSPIGLGLNNIGYSFASLPNGDVVVGGAFTTANNTVAVRTARLTTPCPATAGNVGSGCNSSVGPMSLVATTLPWIGSTFRSTCSGIAPVSLSFGLLGFTSPGTPLSLLHPAGGPGCMLSASPDVTMLLLPSAGQVISQFSLVMSPAFVGLTLFHQVVQIEMDPSLQILQIGSSNAVALTLGLF